MENTNTIQFPNDKPEWFYAVGDSHRGPFKGEEIYQMLQAKELSWIDYLYREQEGQWMRVCDHPVFKSLQPAPPKPKPVMAPPPPPNRQPEVRWFLFQNDTQTGPYQTTELIRLKAAGQIQTSAYVWQDQYTEWKPFGEVTELKTPAGMPAAPTPAARGPSAPAPAAQAAPATQVAPAAAAKPADKRAAPRRPLVAQIYLTNQSDLVTGVCRDISVGGMQVLTDRIPGTVGTSIQLNVAPPSDSGLKPFVAEGVIVRILEDQRGFSFRFTQISNDAKKSIESYIA
jgi:hypothetical protein